MARAACLATASEREGYGLVVVEAAAHGTPSVIVAGAENAAVELVDDGVNGVVAPDATPQSLATALVTPSSGASLRGSTARWFEANAVEAPDRCLARSSSRRPTAPVAAPVHRRR